MFSSLAPIGSPDLCRVLPWRQAPLPFPRSAPRRNTREARSLPLDVFHAVLAAEGLDDRLPDFGARLTSLAHAHRMLYGFSFAPSELRISARDLPWLVAGLAAGLTLRPLVLDSPRPEDVRRLGLDPRQSLLGYRLESLRRSGLRILNPGGSQALAEQLRWPERGSLAECLGPAGLRELPEVYDRLDPSPTIRSRVGQRPRLVLVGRYSGPRRGPLLGAGPDGAVLVVDPAMFPTAASVLTAGCRLLTPEETILLAGAPDLRDGESTFLGCDGPILLGALTPYARIATFTSHENGIQLGTADPWRVHASDRLVAVTG